MIRRFLQALQDHPLYSGATKFDFIEANMSYISANLVASWCREAKYGHHVVESRDSSPRGREGVWTGAYEKEAMAWKLRERLGNDTLCYALDMLNQTEQPASIERHKTMLTAQLRQYRMERVEPSDVTFGKYKYAYTGKTAGGEKDDMYMALVLGDYWGDIKRSEPAHRAWAQGHGFTL